MQLTRNMENRNQMLFPSLQDRSSVTSSSSMASSSPNMGSPRSHQVVVYSSTYIGSSSINHGFLGLGTENHVTTTGRQLLVKDPDDPTASSADHQAAAAAAANYSSKKMVRKPNKYAFQTRSQVDILDDGYRWRKYGQKAVKANKFPRSYYRCTYEGCNVKKQVQRLSKDEGIVITTYQGMHTHPIDKPNSDTFEHILRSQMQLTNYTDQLLPVSARPASQF